MSPVERIVYTILTFAAYFVTLIVGTVVCSVLERTNWWRSMDEEQKQGHRNTIKALIVALLVALVVALFGIWAR